MSRRCRGSLASGSGTVDGGGLSSGCDCGRLATVPIPCTEPLIYGNNILADPGFEQQLIEFPGPNSYEIPRITFPSPGDGFGGGPPYIWGDGTAAGVETFWARDFGALTGDVTENAEWHITDTDPHSGTYHARQFLPSSYTADLSLYPFQRNTCTHIGNRGVGFPYTTRVEPGDLITVSVYAKASTTSTNPFLELWLETGDTNDDTVSQANSIFSLSTSYEQYQISLIAGGTLGVPYYTKCWLFTTKDSGTTTIDVDTASYGLIPAGQGVILCAQASLITIDNSTTETDFL